MLPRNVPDRAVERAFGENTLLARNSSAFRNVERKLLSRDDTITNIYIYI
jgi:hypothetical protein